MSLIVNIGKPAEEQASGGGSYPQAHHSYPAVITDIKPEKTQSGKDLLKVSFNVDIDGSTYEEKMNGLAIFQNDYFGSNVSYLLKAVVASDTTLDDDILKTDQPDLGKLIGKKVGCLYGRQYSKPQYAVVDRVIDVANVKGLENEAKYNEWLQIKKDAKEGGGSKPSTPSTNPFA